MSQGDNPLYPNSSGVRKALAEAFACHRLASQPKSIPDADLASTAPQAADDLIGRKVSKRGGDYSLDGEIVAVVRKRSGAIRYVVEDDRGLLLIMNAKQLGLDEPPA